MTWNRPLCISAIGLLTLSAPSSYAINYLIDDPTFIDPALTPNQPNRIELYGDDQLTINIFDDAFPLANHLVFARDQSVVEIEDGFFQSLRLISFGESSVRIRGGEFVGNSFLLLRDEDNLSSPDDPGRIQLFVQQIDQITDRDGIDLSPHFPSDFSGNFQIDLPPGYGPGSEIRISGVWSNGDFFNDLRVRPRSDTPNTINVWQNSAPIFNDETNVDTTVAGDIQIGLLGSLGEEGALSAVFDPADDGSPSNFTAEYVSGHATQLEQLFLDRGIPTLAPVTADDESFDVWFLDYDGSLDQGDITLELSFDPSQYTDPAQLVVYHYDETIGAWEELSGTIDEINGTITIQTDNLSPFLLGEAGAVPEPTSMLLIGAGGLMLVRRRR